jgi:hypothetical protein
VKETAERQKQRLHFIEHNGQRVLLIDHSHARAAEMEADHAEIQRYVTSQPPNSVLSLCDWTDAEITKPFLTAAKKLAAYDRPHVKKSAIVADAKARDIVRAVEMFSARNFGMFETRDAALRWLTADDSSTEGSES